ncbi:hypothetical protein T439DRAFT_346318 [Meredithblackwellia eburnea MCA 4105]
MPVSSRQNGNGNLHSAQELYDNFKRKHLAQNKEIIHKNSALAKSIADLNRTLSVFRAENLQLRTIKYQLDVELQSCKSRLARLEQREQDRQRDRQRLPGLDPATAEEMLQKVSASIDALQAFHSLMSQPPVPFSPTRSSQSPSPPGLSPSSDNGPSVNTTASTPSSARRKSTGARQPRRSLSTRPDLSLISEATEASTEMVVPVEGWNGTVLEGLNEESTSLSQSQSQLHSLTVSQSQISLGPSSPITRSSSAKLLVAPSSYTEVPASSATRTSGAIGKPPLLRPPSSGPKAPPPAPSSTTNVNRRAPRRISGLVRLPAKVESSSESEDASEAEDNLSEDDDGEEATAEETQSEDDEEEREEEEERDEEVDGDGEGDDSDALLARVAERSRQLSLGGRSHPTTSPLNPGPASTAAARPTATTSRAPRPSQSSASSAAPPPSSQPPRTILKEVQHAQITSKGKERMVQADSTSESEENEHENSDESGSEDEEAEDEVPAPAPAIVKSRISHDLASASTSKKQPVRQSLSMPSLSRSGMIEPEEGVRGIERSAKKLQAMEPLQEETRSKSAIIEEEPYPASQESAEPASSQETSEGGRRARKSVNYALPKLNTKMRRSEDYVPVIKNSGRNGRKQSTAHRPRPSTVQQTPGPPSSLPRSTSTDDLSDVARATSPLASRRRGTGADQNVGAEGEDEEDDQWHLSQPSQPSQPSQSRRRSGLTKSSLDVTSKAGQDLLAKRNAGAGRRHTMGA